MSVKDYLKPAYYNSWQLLNTVNNLPTQTDLPLRNFDDSINVETLTQDKQLLVNDPKVHDLTNPANNQIELLLPLNPPLGKSFLIINSELSAGSFIVNTLIIPPCDRLEIVWNGTIWREI